VCHLCHIPCPRELANCAREVANCPRELANCAREVANEAPQGAGKRPPLYIFLNIPETSFLTAVSRFIGVASISQLRQR
jgi:hypothetical protein